jgi:hypothetical protein
MDKPQPLSPRARLQALLAVPERQRTDAEWDELIELEIMLAPGNRAGAQDQQGRRNGPMPSAHPNAGPGAHGKNRGKKFHKRPPRGKGP